MYSSDPVDKSDYNKKSEPRQSDKKLKSLQNETTSLKGLLRYSLEFYDRTPAEDESSSNLCPLKGNPVSVFRYFMTST